MKRFLICCLCLCFCLPAVGEGIVPLGETYSFDFNTLDTGGEPVAVTGTGTLSVDVYEEGGATEINTADTIGALDGITGAYHVDIAATSGNGFEAGKWYTMILTDSAGAGTLLADGVSIDNRIIGSFRVVAAETTAGTNAVDTVLIEGGDATDALDGAAINISFDSITGTISSSQLETTALSGQTSLASVTAFGTSAAAFGGATSTFGNLTAAAQTNLTTVYSTDYADTYDTTLNKLNVNIDYANGAALPDGTGYKEYYVDDGATGTATGADPTNAFVTIQAAIDALAGEGAHIIIVGGSGPYDENVAVNEPNVWIENHGASITPTTGVAFTVSANNCILQGVISDPVDGSADVLTSGVLYGLKMVDCDFDNSINISSCTADQPDIQHCFVASTEYPSYSANANASLINGGFTDLLIDAIKAKTDSLTFTVAGQVDANTLQIEGGDATDALDGATVSLGANSITSSTIATGAFTTDEFATTALSTQTSLAAITQFGTATATFGTWTSTEMDTIHSSGADWANGGRLDLILDATLQLNTTYKATNAAGDSETIQFKITTP